MLLLLLNLPPAVGVDNLGSCTLAHSRSGHPLQRIDPTVLGEGAQAHRQYLYCPHLIEPRWIEWLRRFECFSRSIPSNYGHSLMWLGVLCIGLRKGYVGHHIILWGHGWTTPPCLHWWPSVITWRCGDSSERWHIVLLCTSILHRGGSLLYNSSSFILPCRHKESFLQQNFLPLNEES
jgi:hypothetical protein